MFFITTNEKFEGVYGTINYGKMLDNVSINLDYVESIDKINQSDINRYGIRFDMNSGKSILWFFIKMEIRDIELKRISDLYYQE